MRKSLLPSEKYRKTTVERSSCVGCKAHVTPGLCYTGSVVEGMGFMTKEVVSRPRFATEIDVTHRRVAFVKRLRGLICDSCASNYHLMPNGEPLVKTDPRPGFVGSLAPGYMERVPSESQAGGEKPHSNPAHAVVCVADNHWLNVGRK